MQMQGKQRKLYAAGRKRNMKKICHELQDGYSRNEVQKFYEGAYNSKRGFKPRITVGRDKIRNLIAGEEHILNRWAEYF
jgi:hypothetical protein